MNSPFLLGMGHEMLSMAQQRRQLEQLHKKLPNNPTLLLTTDQDLSASTKGLSNTLSKAFCTLLVEQGMLGSSCTFNSLLRNTGILLGPVLAVYIQYKHQI